MSNLDRELQIAEIVCRLAKLPNLGHDVDYFNAGLASIQALELLIELESQFGVSLPDDEFAKVRTVRALSDLIQSRSGAVQ
jgi:acyl carrier protein